MDTVILTGKDNKEIFNILLELKGHKLYANKDFEFRFEQAVYDAHWELIQDKRTTFTFKDPKVATWFALLWN